MFFFFFQAEDGIRDLYVTGVQTCALPICRGGAVDDTAPQRRPGEDRPERRGSVGTAAPRWGAASDLCTDAGGRGDPRPGASAGGCGRDPAPRPAAAEGL